MALSVPTPWVHGPNVEAALSSGASAGATAARTSQEGLFESQRLGLEAKRMQQAAQMQQAQLQQASEQHQMEVQAKSKLAEQDQLRSNQRLQIENAYKTSQLGMAKGRLEQTQQAAEQKAQQASDMFRQESGFHQYLQEHPGDYAGAWRSFPRVTSQVVNASYRSQIKEGEASKPLIREGKFPLIEYDPKTRTTTQLYTPPPDTSKLTEVQRETLKNLRHDRDQLEKTVPTSKDEADNLQDKLSAIRYKIDAASRGKGLTAPPLTPAGAPALPTDKSQLKDGQTYQTKKGPATWSEKNQHLVPVDDTSE